jgi:hypothetical protein
MIARSVTRSITITLAIIAFAGAGDAAVAAQARIGPHQHFVGIVNGKRGRAVVDTVCPGPAAKRTGPVKKGQTVAVAQDAHGHGNTGPFSRIYVWFEPVKAGTRPVMVGLRRYGKRQSIPRSVRVPCSGKGQAVFSSCPYLAPCAFGFVQATVKVTFENVAASAPLARADRGRRSR